MGEFNKAIYPTDLGQRYAFSFKSINQEERQYINKNTTLKNCDVAQKKILHCSEQKAYFDTSQHNWKKRFQHCYVKSRDSVVLDPIQAQKWSIEPYFINYHNDRNSINKKFPKAESNIFMNEGCAPKYFGKTPEILKKNDIQTKMEKDENNPDRINKNNFLRTFKFRPNQEKFQINAKYEIKSPRIPFLDEKKVHFYDSNKKLNEIKDIVNKETKEREESVSNKYKIWNLKQFCNLIPNDPYHSKISIKKVQYPSKNELGVKDPNDSSCVSSHEHCKERKKSNCFMTNINAPVEKLDFKDKIISDDYMNQIKDLNKKMRSRLTSNYVNFKDNLAQFYRTMSLKPQHPENQNFLVEDKSIRSKNQRFLPDLKPQYTELGDPENSCQLVTTFNEKSGNNKTNCHYKNLDHMNVSTEQARINQEKIPLNPPPKDNYMNLKMSPRNQKVLKNVELYPMDMNLIGTIRFQPNIERQSEPNKIEKDIMEGEKKRRSLKNYEFGRKIEKYEETKNVKPVLLASPSNSTLKNKENVYNEGACVIETDKMLRFVFNIPKNEIITMRELQIVAEISQGSFGDVYAAYWRGKLVAVKKPKDKMSLEAMRSVTREMNAYRNLNHPLIVRYYGVCLEDTFLAIITEFVPKGNLFDLFYENKYQIDSETRLKLSKQLCLVCTFLHQEKKYVHRDLKTANLILDGYNNLKLCDFGKTRKLEHSGRLKLEDNGGSPRYMAPECFVEGNYIDEKADIWGMACCLIEILGGPIPFEKIYDNEGVIRSLLLKKEKPYVPNWFNPTLRDILLRCFSWNGVDRPSAYTFYKCLCTLTPQDLDKSAINRKWN